MRAGVLGVDCGYNVGPMSDVDKWYRNYWARHEARTIAYQTIIAKCVSCEARAELNEYEQIIFDHTRTAERLLDFGAEDKALKKKFLDAGFRGIYETLDISSEDTHEYSALAQVVEKFDAILCLEVIEHVTLNEYVDLMDGFGDLLKPAVCWSSPLPIRFAWFRCGAATRAAFLNFHLRTSRQTSWSGATRSRPGVSAMERGPGHRGPA